MMGRFINGLETHAPRAIHPYMRGFHPRERRVAKNTVIPTIVNATTASRP